MKDAEGQAKTNKTSRMARQKPRQPGRFGAITPACYLAIVNLVTYSS
jgi:hypothetical protein